MAERAKTKKQQERGMNAWLKRNWLLLLFIAAIAIYVIVECVSALSVRTETQTAEVSTVYNTITATALAVRDEDVLETSSSAVVVPMVSSGEKVGKNGRVAMVFASAEAAAQYSEYTETREKLEYYAGMEAKSVGTANSAESMNREINNALGEYIMATSSGNYDYETVTAAAEKLNDAITSRQILVGEDVDFSGTVKGLTDELNKIDLKKCEPTGYITTEDSGIFSTYTDALEGAFDYSAVTQWSVETLNENIKTASEAAPTGDFGKIINDFRWYICAVVTTEDIKDLEIGDTLEVVLKDSSRTLKCTVVAGAGDTALGQEETVLVLSSKNMDAALSELRVFDIEIRLAEYTGIMVPTQAVHVNEEGQRGVYVLLSSVETWRDVEVKFTGDGYSVLSYSNETENGIKLYDEIIISGKNLKEGKVDG